MDIGGVSTVYADYLTTQAVDSRKEAIQKKLENSGSSDEELMDACREFESYFVEQVFNAMLKTAEVFSDKEDSYASKMVDYFKDSAVQELCSQVSDGDGIGLAKTLYEQMKRQYSPTTIQPAQE
ncbi:MAG: rod-binding protein [Roseburia sp.]|nr:rod-binding protein [Roseburia sp.]